MSIEHTGDVRYGASLFLAILLLAPLGCDFAVGQDGRALEPVVESAPRTAGEPQPDSARYTSPEPTLMSLEEALRGPGAPRDVLAELELVEVRHLDFEGRVRKGQLVVHRSLAEEVRVIFGELLELEFPIEKIVPIVAYDWSDDDSMADNNTSAFNYRRTLTGSMSYHAYGRALDINPRLNPYEFGKTIYPPGAVYERGIPGTIEDGPVVRAFESRGWRWGGRFKNKDWQHFEKPSGRRR